MGGKPIINAELEKLGGFLGLQNNGPSPAEKKYTSSGVQAFSYYSGTQISIWFGDIWVEDINHIQFQYNQEKRPVYGYASQYFDSVAKGQVMIQGSFALNFRDKGYISYIVNAIPELYRSTQTATSGEELDARWGKVKDVISSHLRNGTFGPKTYTELTDFAQSENFWAEAELYEKAIWGGEGEELDPKYIATPDILQHNKFPDGFNILITYGNVGATETSTLQDMSTSTTKSLNGVHLVGSSQVIRATGEPVQEAYSFMAKGMDNYVGTSF